MIANGNTPHCTFVVNTKKLFELKDTRVLQAADVTSETSVQKEPVTNEIISAVIGDLKQTDGSKRGQTSDERKTPHEPSNTYLQHALCLFPGNAIHFLLFGLELFGREAFGLPDLPFQRMLLAEEEICSAQRMADAGHGPRRRGQQRKGGTGDKR